MRRLVSVLQREGSRSPNDSHMGVQVWGIRASSEKPGSCQHKSRSTLMQQEENASPIGSHPQPEVPLVYHPLFHDLDVSNFFKFHELRRCKPWELVRDLLPLARNCVIVDAFEAMWAARLLKPLLHRKTPQSQWCHPTARSECHDIQRVRLHH
jgi:hypothetical protein